MPTTRNRWQAENQEPARSPSGGGIVGEQANEAANPRRRQPKSPPRPSLSPAPELASDLHHDPSPRSPKRLKLNDTGSKQLSSFETPINTVGNSTSTQMPVSDNAIQPQQSAQTDGATNVSSPADDASRAQLPGSTASSLNTRTSPSVEAPSATANRAPTKFTTDLPPNNLSNTAPPSTTSAVQPQGPLTNVPTSTAPNAADGSSISATRTPVAPTATVSQTSTLAAVPHPPGQQAASQTTHTAQNATVSHQNIPYQPIPAAQLPSSHPSPIPGQQASTEPSSSTNQPALNQSTPVPRPQMPQQPAVATRPPPPSSGVPARPPVPPPPSAEAIAELNKSRATNLNTLGDLASQILLLLSKMPVVDAMSLSADISLLASGQQPLSPAPAEYQRLRILFDPIRNLYLTNSPFLVADHLKMTEPLQVETLTKANQAMFCSAIFAGGIGQLALDQSFLDVFVPQHGKLLKSQAGIWLELKTQGFLTAMRLKAAPPNQVMHDLFPAGIEHRILARRPGSRTLAPSEQDFVNRFESRKRILLEHVERNALPELDTRYPYPDLGKEVTNYLVKNHARSSHSGLLRTTGTAGTAKATQGQMQGRFSIDEEQTQDIPLSSAGPVPNSQNDPTLDDAPSYTDIPIEELQRMCKIAMKEAMKGTPFEEPDSEEEPADETNHSMAQPSAFQQYTPPKPESQSHAAAAPPALASSTGAQTLQSIPTHVLYQQARLVVPKSPPPEKTENAVPGSQPRPWTDEEEKALMDGIDQARGPHWSQILALHGAGGSSSEILKNRTQVQLKDKARNLKLFFLKSNIGVPQYLSQVTGTLESRGTAQIEKSETEESGLNGLAGRQQHTPNNSTVQDMKESDSLQGAGRQHAVKIEEPSGRALGSVPTGMPPSGGGSLDEATTQPVTNIK